MTDGIEAAPLEPYALYRWFDARDILLYIGRTGALAQRISGHIARSRWMQLAARSTVERHKTFEDVRTAEREAIEIERPLFNKQYNDTPEAKERLHAYLEVIGRLDLLAPKLVLPRWREAPLPQPFETEPRSQPENAPEPPTDDWADDLQREADIYDARWERAARNAWWRPWWERHSSATDDMLSMFCHIFDPTTAIACCLAERRRGERDGYSHPQVWATYLPSLDEPTENWRSVGQWSAHADVTVAEPWEYWTAATAEAQESFAAALLAAGECTAVQTGKRAVLRGFRDQTPARIAGAILSDLAWGHTDVALECAALLRQRAEREAA